MPKIRQALSLNNYLILIFLSFSLILFNSFYLSDSVLAQAESQNYFITAKKTAALQEKNKNLKIIDLRSSLSYLFGHLPNAVHIQPENLRNPDGWVAGLMPEAEFFSNLMQAKGINNDSRIIIYADQESSALAARLWWLFNFYGKKQVQILSGGYQSWQQAGYDNNKLPPQIEKGNFTVQSVNNKWLISLDTIAENLDNQDYLIIDARPAAEFSGEIESEAAVRKGHLPGSINLQIPFSISELIERRSELKSFFQQANLRSSGQKIVILADQSYNSALTFLALSYAGYNNLKLADAGWTGWSFRSDLPISTEENN
ncbi:sulfurtransferase [Halanaerobium salsuginis]|uniref:Thiosulfate/3-mercaptopyruvate sulfurtransferase n=1 Tax=Halanaerobium salsuginis TaxID=29563 RepID=A0A1I4FZG9_9FIRM|nr:rhodanese-like domain-containing protein [Halanaerobium salsuginis]SFL23312.1 thiosulfate/3-mercaptopyruvate sulfurtransferase [Halanaerobium salsuginis]